LKIVNGRFGLPSLMLLERAFWTGAGLHKRMA
jgi:hypothetical protein